MQVTPEQWPFVSRLLDEALEVPPEARERWLESLPPEDLPFKSTLQTLLRHASAAETRDFLDIFPSLPEGAPHGAHSTASDLLLDDVRPDPVSRGQTAD